jgi:Recombinase/Resolvase, N terminal domain
MILDTSLRPDRALSAFRGRHRKKGNLADFVRKVAAGEVKKGSALIVESLDRLSREEPEEAYDFLRDLLRAGIEVHAILDKEVYRRGEMDELKIFKAVMTHSRSSQESKRKSERCTVAAAQSREKARKGICISSHAPGYLIATKGDKIIPHPQHAKTVKRIFQLASESIGSTRIVDILNADRVPFWSRRGRWYPLYVSELLRSRQVLGEYQPGTKPRGKDWASAGPPIPDYYPRIIDDELWQRVQEIRSGMWARGKVQTGKYHGSGRVSWRNLFSGLVVDNENESMIYKRVIERGYLISSNRAKFKTHQIRYEVFEKLMLKLLNEIDYIALSKDDATSIEEEQRHDLNDTLTSILEKERLRKRYLRVIEGEQEPDDEVISRYRATGIELKQLQAKKESLERAINSTAPKELSKIPAIRIVSPKEYNLRLKDEIRKRVAQIQLTFKIEVITSTGESILGIRPGKEQILAKVIFANGAEKFAFIDGRKATVVW